MRSRQREDVEQDQPGPPPPRHSKSPPSANPEFPAPPSTALGREPRLRLAGIPVSTALWSRGRTERTPFRADFSCRPTGGKGKMRKRRVALTALVVTAVAAISTGFVGA